MSDVLRDLEKAIEDFSEHLYQASQIILVNPEDGIQLDLNEYPDTCFFISNFSVEKGQAILVNDSPLKRDLFEFCCEHQDRVFRGKKR